MNDSNFIRVDQLTRVLMKGWIISFFIVGYGIQAELLSGEIIFFNKPYLTNSLVVRIVHFTWQVRL